jgi:hypothetical protein
MSISEALGERRTDLHPGDNPEALVESLRKFL